MAFHIVVVDDDFALQEFYRLFLEGEGYKVTLLSPSATSPNSIATLNPDLLVLDLLLGGMQSGWPILQDILSIPQTTTLPVLLVTALPTVTLDVEWQAFIQERHIPLLLKPFDVDVLLATIKSLLPSHFSVPEGLSYNEPTNK